MKTIEIKGQTFEYQVLWDSNEWGEWCWTEFYQGTQIIQERKYILFGKKIDKVIPKLMFEVSFNIEDSGYTKEDVRNKLFRKVELLARKEEISKGEII